MRVRREKAGRLQDVARGASSSFVLGSNRRHTTDPSPVQDKLRPEEFSSGNARSPVLTHASRLYGSPPTPAPPLPHLNPAHGPPCAPRLLRPTPRAPSCRSTAPLRADLQHSPEGVKKLVKRELGTTNLGGLAGPEEGIAGAGVTLGALQEASLPLDAVLLLWLLDI